MKRLVSLLIVWASCLTMFGQHDFGIKLNGGLSKISGYRNNTNAISKYGFAPSGQGGLFYDLNFGKRSLIGVELLFSQIGGKEERKIIDLDNFGNQIGVYSTSNLDYHISYFTIPIYYGVKINRLTINFGVQTSFTLASRGHVIGEASYSGGVLKFEDEGKLNITNFDFGLRAGLMYKLTKRIAAEATYYHGISNIMGPTAPADWNWKVQQITIGLRYKLLVLKKEDKLTKEKG